MSEGIGTGSTHVECAFFTTPVLTEKYRSWETLELCDAHRIQKEHCASTRHICGVPLQNQTKIETSASLCGKLQVVDNSICVLSTSMALWPAEDMDWMVINSCHCLNWPPAQTAGMQGNK